MRDDAASGFAKTFLLHAEPCGCDAHEKRLGIYAIQVFIKLTGKFRQNHTAATETYAKILIRRPENKSMDEGIVLDRKSFEALAVESRVRILKSLRQRRKTLSELADELGMSVSGVKEHLQVLEQAELVRKMDDGHKWKYYDLTKKGSDVVAPKELRVWILLSISIIALAASAMAMLYAGTPAAEQTDMNAPMVKALAVGAPPEAQNAAQMPAANETPTAREEPAQAGPDLTVPIAVGAISTITLAGCIIMLWRNRARS